MKPSMAPHLKQALSGALDQPTLEQLMQVRVSQDGQKAQLISGLGVENGSTADTGSQHKKIWW